MWAKNASNFLSRLIQVASAKKVVLAEHFSDGHLAIMGERINPLFQMRKIGRGIWIVVRNSLHEQWDRGYRLFRSHGRISTVSGPICPGHD